MNGRTSVEINTHRVTQGVLVLDVVVDELLVLRVVEGGPQVTRGEPARASERMCERVSERTCEGVGECVSAG